MRINDAINKYPLRMKNIKPTNVCAYAILFKPALYVYLDFCHILSQSFYNLNSISEFDQLWWQFAVCILCEAYVLLRNVYFDFDYSNFQHQTNNNKTYWITEYFLFSFTPYSEALTKIIIVLCVWKKNYAFCNIRRMISSYDDENKKKYFTTIELHIYFEEWPSHGSNRNVNESTFDRELSSPENNMIDDRASKEFHINTTMLQNKLI